MVKYTSRNAIANTLSISGTKTTKKIIVASCIIILLMVNGFCSNKEKKDDRRNKETTDYEPTLYDIPEENKIIEYKGENLVIVREGDKVYALSMKCSDQSCLVKFSRDNNIFECTCSEEAYSINGKKLKDSQKHGLERYKVIEFGSAGVKVEVDTRFLYKDTDSYYNEAFITIP